jgi:FkbM family methyltransferase
LVDAAAGLSGFNIGPVDCVLSTMKAFIKAALWRMRSWTSPTGPVTTRSKIIAKSCPRGQDVIYQCYHGDLSVLIDNARYIESQLLHNGYENWMIPLLDRWLAPGANCIDVGANAGLISLLIAKRVSPLGRVFAFEPSPPFYNRLQKNIQLNPAFSKIIQPFNVGLSDRPGSLNWIEDPEQAGNGLLVSPEQGGGVPVTVSTLDTVLKGIQITALSFVKIDVEGMEYEVLKGGIETWQKHRPIIIFETLPSTQSTRDFPVFEQIAKIFKALNYSCYAIDSSGNLVEPSQRELTHNSVLIPDEKAFDLCVKPGSRSIKEPNRGSGRAVA